MLAREYRQDGLLKRVTITRVADGWTLREERDASLVKQVTYHDWHRVERALTAFEQAHETASALRQAD